MKQLTCALATMLVLAACGDAAAGEGATTTQPAPSPTTTLNVPATTSSTTSTSTTTTSSSTTTSSTTTTTAPDNSGAEGSGCTPGPGALPDGRWYGLVDAVEGTTISFDLACWFTGEAAAKAAAEDGEESPPPNDYYVRNVNPALRDLAVADAATARWYAEPGDPATETTTTYGEWVAGRAGRSFQPGVWLTVAGGLVTEIGEQYTP